MDSIRQQVRRFKGESRLPPAICRRIDAKLDRHEDHYGVRLDGLALSLKILPALYDQIEELSSLSLFFRSHLAIALDNVPPTRQLWCTESQDWVPVIRRPGRILLRNPINGQMESWGHTSSASKSYIVHHRDSDRKSKSRFNGNFSYIEPIERAVFNEGSGILLSANKMQLYASFRMPIGESRKNVRLTHVCLVAERVSRAPQVRKGRKHKSGWMVRLHGYPVSAEDIERDLRNARLSARNLPVLDNPS